ncbi:fibroblast growth factor 10a [Denticeps clupeoides]|uniref:Fibroblast growth factor n=1 Tax=Denticeps clupeoides TaxID=299321 RepID=A0AAY4BR71_9TELE|nr:fibroblast growth factor 10-like [Denticeps clupeoides]
MLARCFGTPGEAAPAQAAKQAAVVAFAPAARRSPSRPLPFSPAAFQHVPFREAPLSPPSSSTMCRWKVTKGAVAWSPLCCLSALLLLLLWALPAAGHDAHRATRPPRAANSSVVVGRHVRSYNHLQGDVRKRKLFSYQKYFLRIDKNGKVNGTKNDKDPFIIFEIKSVDVGVVAIRGIGSNHYLALDKKGVLYGAKEFGTDCKLTERIEENKYNTYASAEWKNKEKPMFVGLNAKGRPLRGRKTRRKHTSTHFLPMVVDPQP